MRSPRRAFTCPDEGEFTLLYTSRHKKTKYIFKSIRLQEISRPTHSASWESVIHHKTSLFMDYLTVWIFSFHLYQLHFFLLIHSTFLFVNQCFHVHILSLKLHKIYTFHGPSEQNYNTFLFFYLLAPSLLSFIHTPNPPASCSPSKVHWQATLHLHLGHTQDSNQLTHFYRHISGGAYVSGDLHLLWH